MKLTIFLFISFLLFLILGSPANASQLSLTAENVELKVNQSSNIDILLSGGEKTLGTDVILLYDPQMIEVTGVKESSLYPNYQPPGTKRIDAQAGKITLSGSANLNQPVEAAGVFAGISFEPLKSGTTMISFDYDPQATNKTGVIDFAGNNLLTFSPSDLKLTLKSANFWEAIFNPFKLFIDRLFGKK